LYEHFIILVSIFFRALYNGRTVRKYYQVGSMQGNLGHRCRSMSKSSTDQWDCVFFSSIYQVSTIYGGLNPDLVERCLNNIFLGLLFHTHDDNNFEFSTILDYTRDGQIDFRLHNNAHIIKGVDVMTHIIAHYNTHTSHTYLYYYRYKLYLHSEFRSVIYIVVIIVLTNIIIYYVWLGKQN